jgi:teichuronic acid biosynthesis glycosyltransferase TuaC
MPPRIIVFSSLFPREGQRHAGLFIRERMFRVGQHLPLVVVSPIPWFPFHGLIRRFRPHFRPRAPRHELQKGIAVHFPRFFSIPGFLKSLDGFFMALGSFWQIRRQVRAGIDHTILDAHFAYPDGYAATLIGKWLRIPVTITLRGTEVAQARSRLRRRLMLRALKRADRVFAVAGSLKRHMVSFGADAAKIAVVGNGVDTDIFQPIARTQARSRLGLPLDAPVLISVGALVERKGFRRVIELLPQLRERFPKLIYLVVGGSSPEGDSREELLQQVRALNLQQRVKFLGPYPPEELKVPLSAADVFVLPTSNEGWANVFLEAMACGLPVVTTDVGGDREVVCSQELGTIVPFGDPPVLLQALTDALTYPWDRAAIIEHAQKNTWNSRVSRLVAEFVAIADGSNVQKQSTSSTVIRKIHRTTIRS